MTTATVVLPATRSKVARARRFPHIRALDGVRGLAYLFVLGHHCFFADGVPLQGQWPVVDRVVIKTFSFGYLGVDIFFVLSGFLITSLLLIERRDKNFYRNFYVKRAFRILPVFLAVLSAVYMARMASTAYVVLSLLFIVNFAYLFHVRSNGVFWSLSVEEQFYLVWPQLVKRMDIGSLRKVLFAVIVAEPPIRFLMAWGHHAIAYYTFTRCDGLAWGALLAVECRLHRLLDREYEGWLWWRRKGRVVLACSLFLTAISVASSFLPAAALWSTAALLTTCPALFAAGMAFILTHRNSRFAELFRFRPLCFIGEISYASYLVHIYVLRGYVRIAGPLKLGETVPFLLRGAVVFAVTTLICTASLYFFERPVMKLRRRFLA